MCACHQPNCSDPTPTYDPPLTFAKAGAPPAGVRHWREAEHWLKVATDEAPPEAIPDVLAAAQVHATLALAAATVYAQRVGANEHEAGETSAWNEVLG